MHLNQQSCVIFSIFARTSSSKDNYFFKNGCNSQCSSFSKNKDTHPIHTVFPATRPELETEFWTFCSKTFCRSLFVSQRPFPTWNQQNMKALYFSVLSVFHCEMNEHHPREISSQDATGGLSRPPNLSENVKTVIWPVFVFHLVMLPSPVSPPLHHSPSPVPAVGVTPPLSARQNARQADRKGSRG